MPLFDFECESCKHEFEDISKQDEVILCPVCEVPAKKLISRLADYTGLNSRTVQYATRRAPKEMQDSHLSKISSDTGFLRKSITKQSVG